MQGCFRLFVQAEAGCRATFTFPLCDASALRAAAPVRNAVLQTVSAKCAPLSPLKTGNGDSLFISLSLQLSASVVQRPKILHYPVFCVIHACSLLGLSFVSNRQLRKEGTFCAAELAGIKPTPPAQEEQGMPAFAN